MGSGIPHDLYLFYFCFGSALSKDRLPAKGWANAERECAVDKGIFADWNFTQLYSVVTPKRYKDKEKRKQKLPANFGNEMLVFRWEKVIIIHGTCTQ